MSRRYRLYFDESGDHTYTSLQNPARRYLGLTGIIVETEHYRTVFHPTVEALKQKHFPHDPDHPLVLHREDLIHKRGAFGALEDANAELVFNADFLAVLGNLRYTLITVVIDKQSHIQRYGDAAYHPYHYCLAALLERYCGLLNFRSAEGDVMGESRGGDPDLQLKVAYRTLYAAGTYYRGGDAFQRVLTSCEIKLKKKEANIAGLQIADLLAHPCKQDVLIAYGTLPDPGDIFGRKIAKTVRSKYNRHAYDGRIEGHGRIFLGPK